MSLRCGEIFSYHFPGNLLLSVAVKIFDNLSAFSKVIGNNIVTSFSRYSVVFT